MVWMPPPPWPRESKCTLDHGCVEIKVKTINGKVKKLSKPDVKPCLKIPNDGSKPLLVVMRKGMLTCLPVSNKVAAELVAAGFSYGD